MRQEFQYHLLNETGLDKVNQVGEIFSTALTQIESLLPAGRALALVGTKLQEACFFAKFGIAVDVANQK